MDIKRVIWTGALLWVLIFFEVSILMFGFKIKAPSTLYFLAHFPLLAILVAIVSYLYFKNQTESGAKSGSMLGVSYLMVGIVLDSIITIPLFIKDYSFFLRADMLIGFLETIIITTLVGAFKK